jgi:DNA-binding MarR family transcriptional regulator
MTDPGANQTESVFLRYRRDQFRMAAMIEASADLNGRMPARGRNRLTDANPHNPQLDAGQHYRLGESAGYLQRRAWQMRLCGRGAVGVGLKAATASAPASEKVFHSTCKDRLCPVCNARQAAHAAPALSKLVQQVLASRKRLFFLTLTVRHARQDSLKSVRKVLDRAWALLIRRKLFRAKDGSQVFSERLRVAEVEWTYDNGWHCHFHVLLQLNPDGQYSTRVQTPTGRRRRVFRKVRTLGAGKIEKLVKEAWAACTARAGRLSWQIDLREIVPHRHCNGELSFVRYWLRPDKVKQARAAAAAGKMRLWTPPKHRGSDRYVYRVQPVSDFVDELTKYITKRQGNGRKRNQKPVWEWGRAELHEYLFGIRGWNMRRASAGWAQVLLEFKESEIIAREIEEAQASGFDFLPWAQLTATARRGAAGLTGQELADFAATMPRVVAALWDQGADLAARQLAPWVRKALGLEAVQEQDLPNLPLAAWQRREWQQEQQAQRMAAVNPHGLKRRHFRILMYLRRREQQGQANSVLSGLGLSRRLLTETADQLQRANLLRRAPPDAGRRSRNVDRWELTATGWAVLHNAPQFAPSRRKRRKSELQFATQPQGG